MDPVSVLAVGAVLGEGPVWIDDAVWFVDIKGHKVHRFDPATKAHQAYEAPDQVGWVLPVGGGGMIAGVKTGLHRFDPKTGEFSLLHDPEPQLPGNRLNDATTDLHGQVWFGSMDDGESQKTGCLYRWANGVCSDAGLPPVAITNGPALNAEGTVLYHTDTLGRVIYRVPVNDDGSLGAPVPFVTIEDGGGYPDGPVVDAEGCLWTGLYAGWSVRRYDQQGKLITSVRLPTANVTKMCFGAPDLKTAYVTSARKNLDDAALAAQPDAGNLFAFEPGVAGLPLTPARITGLGK